ncbi:hypothetical protein A2U01_0088889, partial [Trifolium medium]|nr:hypothetical protein [Trifolium medium]
RKTGFESVYCARRRVHCARRNCQAKMEDSLLPAARGAGLAALGASAMPIYRLSAFLL